MRIAIEIQKLSGRDDIYVTVCFVDVEHRYWQLLDITLLLAENLGGEGLVHKWEVTPNFNRESLPYVAQALMLVEVAKVIAERSPLLTNGSLTVEREVAWEIPS